MRKLILFAFSILFLSSCAEHEKTPEEKAQAWVDSAMKSKPDTSVKAEVTDKPVVKNKVYSSEPTPNYSSSTWSAGAEANAKSRVAKWKELGVLKIEESASKAYITDDVWAATNIDQKKEILLSIVVNQDVEASEEHRFYDFFSYNTGKQIASWNKLTGFDFDY